MKSIRAFISILLTPGIVLALALIMGANFIVLGFLDFCGISDAMTRRRIHRLFGHPEPDPTIDQARVRSIVAAFATPGGQTITENPVAHSIDGKIGIRVELVPAGPPVLGAPKQAFYVEGSHFEMGVLLGMLSEPSVHRMSEDFVDNVIAAYLKKRGNWSALGRIAADFLYTMARYSDAIVPDELSAEIWGLWQGCLMANPDSGIKLRKLFVLNYGIDIILSWVYSGADALLTVMGIKKANFESAVMCNGFAAFGDRAAVAPDGQAGFWFGRDFMFPTCGPIFGECAAHIIYKGDGYISPNHRQKAQETAGGNGPKMLPTPGPGLRKAGLQLAFGAPGMVGAVATINQHGLAMGVDMINSHSCSWNRVGLNSLMMIRFAVQYSETAPGLVDLMARLPRGVSWLYLLAWAGPEGDKAAAIETARKTGNSDFLRYVPAEFRKTGPEGTSLLPNQEFIDDHPSGKNYNGLMVRWQDWQQDPAWFDFNENLFRHLGRDWDKVKSQFGVDGHLCASWDDTSLPKAYYFAPQRDTRNDLMLAGNHFIIPEMRLLGMSDWSATIATDHDFSDWQWRYDMLNEKLRQALAKGPISHDTAKSIINFLKPYNEDGSRAEFFDYYGWEKLPHHRKAVVPADKALVFGSTSLFDMRSLTMETLYDHYADPWAKVSLKAFIGL